MRPSRLTLFIVTAGLALAALPALVSGQLWTVWVGFWGVLVLALLVDGTLAPRRSQLEVEVDMPGTLPMGAPAKALVSISDSASRGFPTRVRVDLSETLAEQPTLNGHAGRPIALELNALRRGRAWVETAWLRFTGPLGLVERVLKVPVNRQLDVVPNIGGVRAQAVEFFSASQMQAGLKVEKYVGDGSEFDQLIEWQRGLDHRSIDWKASARHAKLLSRRFRAERNHQIVVAIDTGRLMGEPLSGQPRLDHAIHGGLLLAMMAARTGDRVGMFAFGERPGLFAEPRGGMHAVRGLLNLSSRLDYSDGETNYTLGLTHLMTRLTRRSLVIVLTDFNDSVTAELMVDNVLRLSRRHLVVFAALSDPLLSELVAAEPRRLDDVDRAVVAESLLKDRELVMTRLRNHGVFCIDARPKQIGVELVNRYLQVKRRELI